MALVRVDKNVRVSQPFPLAYLLRYNKYCCMAKKNEHHKNKYTLETTRQLNSPDEKKSNNNLS